MKKALFVFTLLICVTFAAFSQNASSDRFKALSDTMGRTISSTTSRLENYDDQINDSGNTRTYASYNRKYLVLRQALTESESRLDLLIRSNDRAALIREERDNYAELLDHLEALKSEYDDWLKNVQ